MVYYRFPEKKGQKAYVQNVLWNCCRRFNCRNYRRFRPGVEWREWTLGYHPVYLYLLVLLSYSGDTVPLWIFHRLTRHQVPFSISRRTYRQVWVSSTIRFLLMRKNFVLGKQKLLASFSKSIRWIEIKKKINKFQCKLQGCEWI